MKIIFGQNIYNFINKFNQQLKKANIAAFAGNSAFFLFLSLVPMLMVICSVIPFTPLTKNDIITAFSDVTPNTANALITSIVNEVYIKSAGVISIAIIATIWSAGKGILALIRGFNSIYEVDENRNYLFLRLISSLYTIVIIFVLILSLYVMVFGNQLVDLLLHRIPPIHLFFEFIMHIRFVLVWIILTFAFGTLYTFLPSKKIYFREQIPGAFFSAIIWSIFSYLFSLYVDKYDSFGIYGSLSIIIIIMLWMYFCIYIIFIGAYLNMYFNPINKVLLGKKIKKS